MKITSFGSGITKQQIRASMKRVAEKQKVESQEEIEQQVKVIKERLSIGMKNKERNLTVSALSKQVNIDPKTLQLRLWLYPDLKSMFNTLSMPPESNIAKYLRAMIKSEKFTI